MQLARSTSYQVTLQHHQNLIQPQKSLKIFNSVNCAQAKDSTIPPKLPPKSETAKNLRYLP